MARLSNRQSNTITLSAIGLLLAIFAGVSWFSAHGKSATIGESLRAFAGYVQLRSGDFRLGLGEPPLAGMWSAIPHSSSSLKVDRTALDWERSIYDASRQPAIARAALYQTAGNDPEAFLDRSRAMMTALGAALGAMIAWLAWELGGRIAAIGATALYAFDPNFIAHASLVHGEVALALVSTALILTIYRAGQRFTVWRFIAITLLSAAALTMSFMGLLALLAIAVLLLSRALMDRPWLVFTRLLVDRMNRLGLAMTTIAMSALVGYVALWVCYGSRYSATDDAALRLDTSAAVRDGTRAIWKDQHDGAEPTKTELTEAARSPAMRAQFILWLDQHRLLPQAYLAGALEAWARSRHATPSPLGADAEGGWDKFVPIAIVLKTPLATMLAVTLATLLCLSARWRSAGRRFDRWAVVVLAAPLAIFAVSLMTGNAEGVRHALPIYAIAFVWIGSAFAHARATAPKSIAIALCVIVAGLAVESARAFPNFIAFANAGASQLRGERLLRESNLDWGQDLKLLREWKRAHRDVELYIDCYTDVAPNYFVQATPLVSTDMFLTLFSPSDQPTKKRVLAISATRLHGGGAVDGSGALFDQVARHRPMQVLGRTIYLYQLPLVSEQVKP